MFKALLKVRFLSFANSLMGGGRKGGQSKGLVKSSKGRIFLLLFLLVYIFGVFGFLFYNLFGQLFDVFYSIDQLWFLYLLISFMAFILSFIGSIMMTQSQLYNSTDNEMLLAMPIKPSAILLSRIVSLYLTNLLFTLLPMGTCLVVMIVGYRSYGAELAPMQIVVHVLMTLTIPLLALAFSCILGFLVALISSKMRNKTLISIILTVAFLAVYMYAINNMQEFINYMMSNGSELATKYSKIMPLYMPGAAISEGNILYFLAVFGVSLAIFLAVYAVLSVTFVKIATTKKGAKKKKYVAKELKMSSVRVALLKKELMHFFKSTAYVLNGLSGNLMLIVFALMFIIRPEILEGFGSMMSNGNNPIADMLPLMAMIMLLFTSAFNIVSAPSISVEAKTLWITRSMPVMAKDIFEAKALMHFVICEPFSFVIGLLLGIFLKAGTLTFVIMLLTPLVYNLFNAYFGVYINLKHPKFNWINETQAIKQSISVMIAMFSNMGIIVSFVLIYLFLLRTVMSVEVYILAVTGILLVLTFIIRKYLTGEKAAKRLSNIS